MSDVERQTKEVLGITFVAIDGGRLWRSLGVNTGTLRYMAGGNYRRSHMVEVLRLGDVHVNWSGPLDDLFAIFAVANAQRYRLICGSPLLSLDEEEKIFRLHVYGDASKAEEAEAAK